MKRTNTSKLTFNKQKKENQIQVKHTDRLILKKKSKNRPFYLTHFLGFGIDVIIENCPD